MSEPGAEDRAARIVVGDPVLACEQAEVALRLASLDRGGLSEVRRLLERLGA